MSAPFMVASHSKRAHSPSPEPTSPSSISSTSSEASELVPPRKRRVPPTYVPSSDDGEPRPSRKRRISSDEDDMELADASSDAWSTSAVGRGRAPLQSQTKRLRRELSDKFAKIGLDEGSHTQIIAPSSVAEPGEGEIGPAVWVRHATTDGDGSDDVTVEGVEDDDDGAGGVGAGLLNEAKGKEIGFWRGRTTGQGQLASVYCPPSYLQHDAARNAIPLPRSQDDWRKAEGALVIYKPPQDFSCPNPASYAPPSIASESDPTTLIDAAVGMETDSSPPTPVPLPSNGGPAPSMYAPPSPESGLQGPAHANWLASGMAENGVRLGQYAGETFDGGGTEGEGEMEID